MVVIDKGIRRLVVEKHQEGLSLNKIAKMLKISRFSAQNIWKKFQLHCTIEDLPRSGRPVKLSKRDERILCLISSRNPFWGAKIILSASKLASIISLSTCKNVLMKQNLRGYVAAKKPLLKKRHLINRRKFCKRLLSWNTEQINSIVFLDETRIDLYPKHRQFVRRHPADRFQAKYAIKTFKEANGSLNIWGYIKSDGSRENYNRDQVFMQDDAPCHTSRSTLRYLDEKNIRHLQDWPAQSPDLNPIENLWSYLKGRVGKHICTNVDDLWRVTQQEFDNIPTEYVEKLFNSFKKRLQLCLFNKGGHTSIKKGGWGLFAYTVYISFCWWITASKQDRKLINVASKMNGATCQASDIFIPNQWNHFWLLWSDNEIQFGSGRAYGQTILARIPSTTPLDIRQILLKNSIENVSNLVQISDKECPTDQDSDISDGLLDTCMAIKSQRAAFSYKLMNRKQAMLNTSNLVLAFKKTQSLTANFDVYTNYLTEKTVAPSNMGKESISYEIEFFPKF
ncbi:DgyrCDS9666 [Dimorphilus gyrociliatus]|uniref:DgyrCDS9666 n=1 Tax=Dimorphilus gyrociliatus TaxID=2664684 RepID=A0A7I8W0D0_9ANNE|nr:DgyrCDS9666 [Dimorphilus gyrociliatus]